MGSDICQHYCGKHFTAHLPLNWVLTIVTVATVHACMHGLLVLSLPRECEEWMMNIPTLLLQWVHGKNVVSTRQTYWEVEAPLCEI